VDKDVDMAFKTFANKDNKPRTKINQ